MHYTVKDGCPLPHDPLKAIVAPRPIGWISTLSKEGIFNLAPYSFFNAISSNPHLVMFSSVGWKDSASNARDTGEFVCNFVGEKDADAMNTTSVDAPSGISEAEFAGLSLTPSYAVAPPRYAPSWSALECKVTQIIEPKGISEENSGAVVVIGEVIEIYIDDDALTNGMFDLEKTKPFSRLGYLDFGKHGEMTQMPRPVWPNK